MSKDISKEANPPALVKLFADSSMAKLLDFLTLYKDFDYSKVEISRYAGVSWRTLFRIWPLLERYGLVVKTRRIGRATLYKFETGSPIAKALHQLSLQIAFHDARKTVQEETKEEIQIKA